MSNYLRKLLGHLHDLQLGGNEARVNELVAEISNLVYAGISASESDLCTSLLFNGKRSILNFAKKISLASEFTKCLENILTMVHKKSPSFRNSIGTHAEIIMNSLLDVFRNVKSSTVKEKIISIAIMLVEMRVSHGKPMDYNQLRKICQEELGKRHGSSSSVKCSCLHLLGVLCQYYPQQMVNQRDGLIALYLRELKQEFHGSSDLKIIEGCLRGLCCLMTQFTIDAQREESCREIFKFTLISLQPKHGLTRHAIPIAGLQMVQKHISQFGRLVIEHFEMIYTVLQKWFLHQNVQLRHEGHMALLSFLKQIVASVYDESDQARSKKICTYFVSEFQKIIESSDSGTKELSLAIQGYGLFARLCKKYLDKGYIKKMLSVMIAKSNVVCLSTEEAHYRDIMDQLHQMPSFIFSLADILREVIGCDIPVGKSNKDYIETSAIAESMQRPLTDLCVYLIGGFKQLNIKFYQAGCLSLISLMSTFSCYPHQQKEFVSEIVFQGLIKCLSNTLDENEGHSYPSSVNEGSANDVDADSRITLARWKYLELWKGFILSNRKTEVSSLLNYQTWVRKLVFSEVLNSVYSIINKLDFALQNKVSDHDLPSDISRIFSETSSAFRFFDELSKFFGKFLHDVTLPAESHEITKDIFLCRARRMITELVKTSPRFQRAPGIFYMLSNLMGICIEFEYFTGNFNPNACQCKRLLRTFVPEVLSRIAQSSVDVAYSMIFFLLSLPNEIAVEVHGKLVDILQMTFHLGLGNADLAYAGLKAIERWRHSQDPLIPVDFSSILSHTALFLNPGTIKVETLKLFTGNKRAIRGVRESIGTEEETIEEIQEKVVKFLGTLGGMAHSCFSDKVEHALPVTRSEGGINYTIPFLEIDLNVDIDIILPRICKLASESPDRQTKITACELLHSFTTYIIGKTREIKIRQDSSSDSEFYENFIPVIIQLSSDTDKVVRMLFEPLMMQMIHWFAQCKSPICVILLKYILRGLVNQSNEWERTQCAEWLNEFLSWTAKQTSSTSSTVFEYTRPVFETLCNLARNPKPYMRLSSATAFNHICGVLKDHDEFTDEFIFEMLAAFIDGFALSHEDDNAIGARRACLQALNHIKDIVILKKDLLNKTNQQRRGPCGFHDHLVTLSSVIEWLFKQCRRPQTDCRNSCMGLVCAFSCLLPHCESFSQWMEDVIKLHGVDQICSIFNSENSQMKDLGGSQIFTALKENTLSVYIQTLDVVLANLEYYCWVIKHNSPASSELVKGISSNFMGCWKHSIRKIAFCGSTDLLKKTGHQSAQELGLFCKKRCSIIIRALELTDLLLKQSPSQINMVLPSPIWRNESLLSLFSSCLIKPHSLGFDLVGEFEEPEELLISVKNLLVTICHKSDEVVKQQLLTLLRSELQSEKLVMGQFSHLEESDSEAFAQVVCAYQIVSDANLFHTVFPEMQENGCQEIAHGVVRYVFSSSIAKVNSAYWHLIFEWNVDSPAEKFNRLLLSLGLKLGVNYDFLVNLITDNTVACDEHEEHVTTHGDIFFSLHKNTLSEEICCKPHGYIFSLARCHKSRNATEILMNVMDFLINNRFVYTKYYVDVCENILLYWTDSICSMLRNESSEGDKFIGVRLLIKLLLLYPQVGKDTSHSKHQSIFNAFSMVLTSPVVDLPLKIEVLAVLDCFVGQDGDVRNDALHSCLHDFCTLHFPSRSCEFDKSTYKFKLYTAGISKLLQTLKATGSTEILVVLISIFCREYNHVLQERFDRAIRNCLKNVLPEKQKAIIDIPYKLHASSSSPHGVTIRSRIVDLVLTPLLCQCAQAAVQTFFVSHIGEIMNCMVEDITEYAVGIYKDKMVMKSCSYKLAEMMFSLLPADCFVSETSPLVQAYASSTASRNSRKFLKDFMAQILKDKKGNMLVEKKLLHDELRLFRCSVLNAAIAAIKCTQSDLKWFDAFIFSHNPKKKEFLFEDIIEENRHYSFPVSRGSLQRSRNLLPCLESVANKSPCSKPAEASPSLDGNSLNRDLDQFDLNASQNVRQESPTPSGAIGKESAIYTELENCELNKHECMAKLISVIVHMHDKNIGFYDVQKDMAQGSGCYTTPLPKWMATLLERLNSKTFINVKLFIVKLIINCERVFQPYCSYFIVPFVKLIVLYMKADSKRDTVSHSIDQFVEDSLVTALLWNSIAMPKESVEDKVYFETLVEVIMNKVFDKTQVMVKRNVNLFKAIIRSWKTRISCIATDVIFHHCRLNENNAENLCGLQLAAVLLSNGLPPYTFSVSVEKVEFFRRIFGLVHHSNKAVSDAASVIMGMSLQHLASNLKDSDMEIHNMAKQSLQKLTVGVEGSTTNMAVFVSTLHKVSKQYPPLAEPFLSHILYNMPKVSSTEMKICCLEILRRCIRELDSFLAELKAKHFIDMLILGDATLQLSCLKLCNSLLEHIITAQKEKPNEPSAAQHYNNSINFFLPHLKDHFLMHPSLHCREEMYGIAMEVYSFQNRLPIACQSSEILGTVRTILIQGLSEPEEPLRMKMMRFWCEGGDHSPTYHISDLSKELLVLFKEFYTPEVDETRFLSSCCNALMYSASKSPKFFEKIYTQPLLNCDFQDVEVPDTLLATIHPPSYADATPFDVGSSDNKRSNAHVTLDEFPFSESAVAYETGVVDKKKSWPCSQKGTEIYLYPEKCQRKRFEEEKSMHEKLRRRLRIYRAYRFGEVPDIQIAHREIIIPLAALTQMNSAFLHSALAPLINAIIKEQRRLLNQKYIEDLSKLLMEVLASSLQHSPTFIACIFSVILQNVKFFNVEIATISRAAVKSGQIMLGARIIEEWLIHQQDAGEPESKRIKSCSQMAETSQSVLKGLVELARLHQNDFDALRGIFSMAPITRSLFSEVIKLENNREYSQALKVYQKALSEEMIHELSDVEKPLWEDCLVSCLEKLGQWSDVDQFCSQQIDGSLDSSWSKLDFQERFLKPSIHAKLVLMLQGDVDSKNELWNFFENAINHGGNQKKVVESKYSYYIALIQAHQGDYGQAYFYLRNAVKHFCSRSDSASECDSVSELLHLTDLEDFVQIFHNGKEQLSCQKIQYLTSRWSKRLPHYVLDSVDVWEDMWICRSFFLDKLVAVASNSNPENADGSQIELMKSFVNMKKLDFVLCCVDRACEQKCFSKAKKLLNLDANNILQSLRSSDKMEFAEINFSIGMGKYYLTYASHLIALNTNVKYLVSASKALLESYHCIKRAVENNLAKERQALHSSLYYLLGKTFSLALDILEYQYSDGSVSTILENIVSSISTVVSGQLDDKIRIGSVKTLKSAIDSSPSFDMTNDSVNMFLTYAKLCDRIFQETTDNKPDWTNHHDHVEDAIKYILRVMCYDGKYEASQEASLKFPRLLQLVELFPNAKSHFVIEAQKVPTWMYLRWISQIIALLDKPESDAVHNIITSLAQTFPQAVIYPIKTSGTQLHFRMDDLGKRQEQFVTNLISSLDSRIPVADKLIMNLSLLANPSHIFKNWLETSVNTLKAGQKATKVLTEYQNMYKELFSPIDGASVPTCSSYRGNFAEIFRPDVELAFGGSTGGKTLFNEKEFLRVACGIHDRMKEYCLKNRPQTMKEYSSWLATFHAITLDEQELEIPGQYETSGKPIPEHHIKIVGFENSLTVLSSLQQPKKITIKGSDSLGHDYLVKGNEDMRQDQRIQQLLCAVNAALEKDPACSHRGLQINCYKVIPVTTRLGLIEWVPNTVTLYDIMAGDPKVDDTHERLNKARQRYSQWLHKFVPKSKSTTLIMYGTMTRNASYAETKSTYHQVLNEVPAYLLRNSFLKLSLNPEAYITLRKQFVATYATLCASHWILGVGDRHASNCLISKKHGSVVGIDFGHSFGTATEVFPVPELVPFRLTRQICNLMAPHPPKEGAFRQCMLYSLRAIRQRQDIIFTMLEIFLKEPSVDWLKQAHKLVGRQETFLDLAWYPAAKIALVKQKLRGCNPIQILSEDLKNNRGISSYCSAYKSIACGEPGGNRRMKYNSMNLSVDDQVDCLLDIATDPNILGRTFIGWKFWL